MNKNSLFVALVLALNFVLPASAEEETFTITTYYPSPYGSYNQLEVYRSVTYKPIDRLSITDPKEGELVYDANKEKFYYHNGSKWVVQGYTPAIYSVKCPWNYSTSYAVCTSSCPTEVPADNAGTFGATGAQSCEPPSCAKGYLSLGTGCAAMSSSATTGPEVPVFGHGKMTGYSTYQSGYCERICVKED